MLFCVIAFGISVNALNKAFDSSLIKCYKKKITLSGYDSTCNKYVALFNAVK